jgi:hypothetical protein
MRAALALVVVTCALVLPSAARAQADEQAVCDAALPSAERARRQHRLLESRDQYRVCARAVCGGLLSSECAKGLAEVEARVPSIVFSAESDGRPLDAAVRAGTATIAGRLDGRSVDADPGEHVYTFVTADGRRKDVTVVVNEGNKVQRVVATFEVLPAAPAVASSKDAERPPPDRDAGLRTVGFVLGGAGVAGLAAGGIFGLMAISNKNEASCDPSGACDAGSLASARSAATASTIGFVAGGLLLGAGIGVVLFTFAQKDGSTAAPPRAVRVAPSLGTNAGGLSFAGAF